MPIELHTWNTPNGRKISVALEEMALPYTVHPVNIGKNEQFHPDFLKISPNNRIPAIVDPDGPGGAPISVFESGAILIYLAEKTGKFMPSDTRQKVPVLEWLMWQMGGFGPMPGQVHHFIALENETDRAYGLKRFMAETRRLYVPINSLHAKGFASIGCAPCTRALRPGEAERNGRWWWEQDGHKECGLHLPRNRPAKDSPRRDPVEISAGCG